MKNRIIVICVLIACSFNIQAQKARVVNGDLTRVKLEKNIRFSFSYDNMKVGEEAEAHYTERKLSENNADKPGKGDKWLKNWIGDRAEVYEPAFIKYFKKTSKLEHIDNGYMCKIF